MGIGHEFACASGSNINDCHWLGYRFDEETGFTPQEGESWIGLSQSKTSHSLMNQRGWMTGLWRTQSRVWVSESSGRIYMNPSFELRKEPWSTTELGATLQGVWGLCDDLVFTWGMRRGAPVAFLFDGSSWREVATPGQIVAVHGARDDLIYAVGLRGLIARWDGAAFHAVDGPTPGNLTDLYVAADDELYACGTDGHLLLGTVHGWKELLRFDGMLHCVAKWRDQVWIGGDTAGLFRLEDDRLVSVKPLVHAQRFDTRDHLLITAPNAIVHTSNGVDYLATFVSTFSDLTSHEAPSWRP